MSAQRPKRGVSTLSGTGANVRDQDKGKNTVYLSSEEKPSKHMIYIYIYIYIKQYFSFSSTSKFRNVILLH
jgi:hypothetical protein